MFFFRLDCFIILTEKRRKKKNAFIYSWQSWASADCHLPIKMPAFSNKPVGRSQSTFGTIFARISPQVRRHPVLMFGFPFVLTIVASSFGLSYMTQTRYDYNASKVQSLSKEEELGMRKDRRKIDIREEYYVCD